MILKLTKNGETSKHKCAAVAWTKTKVIYKEVTDVEFGPLHHENFVDYDRIDLVNTDGKVTDEIYNKAYAPKE